MCERCDAAPLEAEAQSHVKTGFAASTTSVVNKEFPVCPNQIVKEMQSERLACHCGLKNGPTGASAKGVLSVCLLQTTFARGVAKVI